MSTFGNCLASFAETHTGCTAHINVPLYLEAVAPDVDHVEPGLAYFVNARPPSTCGLFGSRCIAAALASMGLPVPDYFTLSYPGREIGEAVENVEKAATSHGAWEPGTPTAPFLRGDIVVIGYEEHVVVCTADVTVQPDGSWTGETAQGGQIDGGVQAFASTWHWKTGKLYAGTAAANGTRYVLGVMRATKMAPDAPPGDPSGPADDTTAQAH